MSSKPKVSTDCLCTWTECHQLRQQFAALVDKDTLNRSLCFSTSLEDERDPAASATRVRGYLKNLGDVPSGVLGDYRFIWSLRRRNPWIGRIHQKFIFLPTLTSLFLSKVCRKVLFDCWEDSEASELIYLGLKLSSDNLQISGWMRGSAKKSICVQGLTFLAE